MTTSAKCERALSHKRKGPGYNRCGKPAGWMATDSYHGGHEYGLCDEHLAEMRENNIITDSTPVRWLGIAGETR